MGNCEKVGSILAWRRHFKITEVIEGKHYVLVTALLVTDDKETVDPTYYVCFNVPITERNKELAAGMIIHGRLTT